MSLTTKEMLAIFNAGIDEWLAEQTPVHLDYPDNVPVDYPSDLPKPINWAWLFAQDFKMEWLVENVWPVGSAVHLHAPRKVGKSLTTLWIALELANGRDPFTGVAIKPVVVGYLDYEMTEKDLWERANDMGYNPDSLRNLHYFLHPVIPALDTEPGGIKLMRVCQCLGIQALMVDTVSRVISGDENSNDTFIRFYRYTGEPLKRVGISLWRLDHEGHENNRSRGASGKADDVDIVWQLRSTDNGYVFNRMASRLPWVPECVNVQRVDEPDLRLLASAQDWPAGTEIKAMELDGISAPIDISKRKAAEMLRSHGFTPGKATILMAAIRYRRASFPSIQNGPGTTREPPL
jgi:AAA domain